MKSHIQISKYILKRFENNQHALYYIDIADSLRIKKGHAKSLNTEYGHYSMKIERYLQEKIETPFSQNLKSLDSVDFDNDVYIPDEEFCNNVKLYAISCFARSPHMVEIISDNSILTKVVNGNAQYQHDLSVYYGTNNTIRIFKDFNVTFIENRTVIPLVLPMSGIYGCEYHGIFHIVMPINPKRALLLVRHDKMNNDKRKLFITEDIEMVNCLNSEAFRNQKKQNYGFVVAPGKDELNELLQQKSNMSNN